MYQFCSTITPQEHDAFVEQHPLCNLLQSSAWASVKENWEHTILGVKDRNDTLVASSLCLIKKLPLGFTMFYIPRGPILDYENKEIVSFYFRELKRYGKKRHCLFVKFDPEIHIRDFTLQEKDKPYKQNTNIILENLKTAGVIHKGFTTYIKETIQPRFCMGVESTSDMDAYVPRATLRSKNVALRKHVKVQRVGMEGLDAFSKVMHMTEVRKSVQLRNADYFRQLMEIYGEHAYLFLASVNPKERETELIAQIHSIKELLQDQELGKKQRKKLEEEVRQAEQELASMDDILRKYHKEEVIAGGLMIGYGDTVEMLYAGMNEDFRTFRPQYLTYMTQFSYAFEQGYRYVTMGGIEGTLEDGLAKYKSNFNPIVNEFIGEFDLPVNRFLYALSEKAYELRKKKSISHAKEE